MTTEPPKRCAGITEGHERITGQVKWYDATKGYGFIGREGENDVFVHITAIWSEDVFPRRPVLLAGETVEFYVAQSDKGVEAREVSLENGVAIPKRPIRRFFKRSNRRQHKAEVAAEGTTAEAPKEETKPTEDGQQPERKTYRRYRRNNRKNNKKTEAAAPVASEAAPAPAPVEVAAEPTQN
ncbi:hypothetical protein WA158_003807 [Blastocystis sp. Blastoise]